MSHDDDAESGGAQVVTRAGQWFICGWALLIVLTASAVGTVTCLSMYRHKSQANQRHRERMEVLSTESGEAAGDAAGPTGSRPLRVQTGIYVDRIAELSIKNACWVVDFYVWFRWRGPSAPFGEDVQVVDGWIEERHKEDEYVQGDEHYELYRIVARISKFFDITRFPVEDHQLVINLEHPAHKRHEMVFVADESNTEVSSRVRLPAYRIRETAVVERPHAYKTTRGDPRLREGQPSVYSQLRLGIWLERDGWGFYFKLFQGLFASIAVAFAAFFIKPTDVDPRFGLGVGAFFASIANTYITSSLIPDTGMMTLADFLNGLAMLTIFLSVVQSVISLYLYDIRGQEALSRLFDKVSALVFTVGVVGINVALPLAASN